MLSGSAWSGRFVELFLGSFRRVRGGTTGLGRGVAGSPPSAVEDLSHRHRTSCVWSCMVPSCVIFAVQPRRVFLLKEHRSQRDVGFISLARAG